MSAATAPRLARARPPSPSSPARSPRRPRPRPRRGRLRGADLLRERRDGRGAERRAVGEDAVEDRGDVGGGVHRLDALAEPTRTGESAEVEARELPHLEDGHVLAAALRGLGEDVPEERAALGGRGRGRRPALREGPGGGGEDPRVPERGAADHHAVAARLADHVEHVVRGEDVAVADHRDRDGLLDRADRVAARAAGVALFARSAVDGDGGGAGRLERLRDVHRLRAVVPARADLHGDGHGDAPADAVDDLGRFGGLAKQRAPRAAVDDLADRAAHVHVDRVRAAPDEDRRRLAHDGGVGARDLDDARTLVVGERRELERALVPAHDALGHAHLRRGEGAAEPAHDSAEREVGEPRHRREEERRVDDERAQPHGRERPDARRERRLRRGGGGEAFRGVEGAGGHGRTLWHGAAGTPPAARRMPSRPSVLRRAQALVAAVVLVGLSGSVPASAAEAPSRAERASYWLDRIVRGPELTTYLIPNFHQTMLDDAEANLRATPAETLERLADPEFRIRLTTQANADPWHAILHVLAAIGKARPDVVRAWAVPALDHDLLTLEREALPALAALESPEDGPALLRALRRRTNDRAIGPGALRALARLGPPWDGEAALAVLAAAEIDQLGGSSTLWEGWVDEVAEARGGPRPAALAWWAILAESSGPLARAPHDDPHAAPAATVRLADSFGSGAFAAARAKAALARLGVPGWLAAVRRDAASRNAAIRSIAHAGLPLPGDASVTARARALSMAEGFEGGAPAPDVAEAIDVVTILGEDPSEAATAALARLLETVPPGLGARIVLQRIVDALVARGFDLASTVARLLSTGDRTKVDRALTIAQRAPSPRFLPLRRAFFAGPGNAPRRFGVRRTALFIVTASLRREGLPPEALARWARRTVEWAFDPADRSGLGLLAVLLDLGPAGEAALAEGLSGPQRRDYLEIVSHPLGRYLAPET